MTDPVTDPVADAGAEVVADDATVAALLARRASDDHPGVICGDETWTWRQVIERSQAVGHQLVARRQPGPFHVGVLLDNTPDYLFLLFGAALAGAAVVGINSTRRGDELARDIRHTDCQLVVTDDAGRQLLAGVDLGPVPVVAPDELVGPAEQPASPLEGQPPQAEDLFALIFTSGSTGAPKAVRMTHGRAAAAARGATWFSADDILYSAMPLFHGNALNAIVLPAVASGATIALRPRFSASQFMPDVRRYRATFFSTVGRALILRAGHARDPRGSPALRQVRAGPGVVARRRASLPRSASGSPCSRATARARTPSS